MKTLGMTMMVMASATLAVDAWAQDKAAASAAVSKEISRLAQASQGEQAEVLAEVEQNFGKVLLMQPAPDQAADEQRAISEVLAFRRADVQSGASSGASGSTTVASSPLLPAIFGVALESGALTRSVSGTTITLKLNPAGLLCASDPAIAAAVALREDDACRTVWKRVGVTAAFDAARGAKSVALEDFQTLERQFSELTVRIELVNHRKTGIGGLQRRFKTEYDEWQKKAANLGEQVDQIAGVADAKRALVDRLDKLLDTDAYKALNVAQRTAAITEVVNAVAARSVMSAEDVRRARTVWLKGLQSFDVLTRAVATAPILTAEYGLQKPDLAKHDMGDIVAKGSRPPSLHSLRLIYAQGLPRRRLDVTANLSASLFDQVSAGMPGRFRDVRAAVEGKWKLREVGNYGVPTLSMAAMYAYLHQQPLGLGLTAFNQAKLEEKGHIGLFQAKLEFPTGNNAVRIPLSFTYSNRTELVKESEVRGQFGLSFNLDALFANR